MKKLAFFTAIIVGSWTNFGLNTDYALAKKINDQAKLVKLDNLNDSSLEVFINDSDLTQNISTKNAELNLSFDASNLINNTLLPTSFKIEVYDVTTDRRLLGIFRPSIFNERRVSNFKTNIELVNLTKSSNLEINIYNTKNVLLGIYNANIVIENQSEISFTELEAADCTGEFGKCQLEYIFQNIHFTTLPSKGLKTKIEQNTDGTYSVNLPLAKGKKRIRVKNIFGNANGDSGSSGNQDFSFDFDGSNLFVIKDGVTTLVAAQGPAGNNGATGPKGDDGASGGGFSSGNTDINGTLTFIANGKLQDAVLNGFSLAMTNNGAQVPFTVQGAAAQTANLQEWRDSVGTVFSVVDAAGNIGVGTSSPSVSLDIAGRASFRVAADMASFRGISILPATFSGNQYIRAAGNGGSFNIVSASTGSGLDDSYIRLSPGVGNIDFGTNASSAAAVQRMRIDSAGNVGIGTISPGAKLEVETGTAVTIGQIIKGAAAQTANLTEWQNSAGTVLASLTPAGSITAVSLISSVNAAFYVEPQAATSMVLAGVIRAGQVATTPTYTWDADPDTGLTNPSVGAMGIETGNVERMRFDSSGNVGIGTTSPRGALDVRSANAALDSGTGQFTGAGTGQIFVGTNSGSQVTGEGGQIGLGTYLPGISAQYPFAIIKGIAQGGENLGALVFGTMASDSGVYERMRITSTGNVGIGESSPGAKLQVNTGAAGTIGTIFKGAAAQTANLTEWQNDAGTSLVTLSPAGSITTTGIIDILPSNPAHAAYHTVISSALGATTFQAINNDMYLSPSGKIFGTGLGNGSAGSVFSFSAASIVSGDGTDKGLFKVTGTYDPTSTAADFQAFRIDTTINQTGTASGNYTGFAMNVIETSVTGTNNRLMDLKVDGTSRFLISNGGNVGVGIPIPARKMHISEAMRLEPQSSPPSSPNLGDLYVDSDSNELCFYDGSSWTGIKAGGVCS